MSDDGGLTDVITEEVTDQVGIAELLGDSSLEEEIDGGELGAAVGRKVGAQIGRELGASIGREVHETLRERTDEQQSLSGLRSDVTTGVRDGLRSGIDELGGREALTSLAQQTADGSPLEGMIGESDESEPDSADAPAAADEEPTAEAEAEAESEDESAVDSEEEAELPGPAAADIDDLRRETLEDFLGVMAYEDLQSIAKDVGVKANLSREEMTEEIVETVTSDDESSNAGESAEEGSNTEERSGAESTGEGESRDEESPQEAD